MYIDVLLHANFLTAFYLMIYIAKEPGVQLLYASNAYFGKFSILVKLRRKENYIYLLEICFLVSNENKYLN